MDQRRMCPQCRAFITVKDRICPYCNEQVGARAVERRSSDALAGFIPHAHFTTVLLLLINFGFFAATTIYSMRSGQGNALDLDTTTLRLFGAKYAPLIDQGQWWRLITAGFLHGGLIHILMNSWVMFDLGAAVEEAYGTARLVVIYIVATVTGFYVSYLYNPATSIGASAALCGLLGAMLALGLRERSSVGDAMRGMYIRWVIFLLLISVVGAGIDLAAHVGGLAGGFAIAYLAGQPKLTLTLTEKFWRVGAWFAVGVTISAFISWYRWYLWAAAQLR